MVHICNRDAESAVELRHGAGGGVPIVYHHHPHVTIFSVMFNKTVQKKKKKEKENMRKIYVNYLLKFMYSYVKK